MINVQKARELLKAAMETQGPDFKYATHFGTACLYEKVTDGLWMELYDVSLQGPNDLSLPGPDDPRRKTACLIGVALDLHGETFHHGSTTNIHSLALHNPTRITSQAGEYFRHAQKVQDSGGTWGNAYEEAERFAEKLIQDEAE